MRFALLLLIAWASLASAHVAKSAALVGHRQTAASRIGSAQVGMKVDIVHVPYTGTAQAVPAMLSGEVALVFSAFPSIVQHVKAQIRVDIAKPAKVD